MIEFKVQDMTCGHCVSTVTRAVQEVDPQAVVKIDLPTHRVAIESSGAAAAFQSAIEEAGYTPQPA